MARILEYTITPLPDPWPGEKPLRTDRIRSPFKVRWSELLVDLGREVEHLGGTRVELAVDVTDYDIRQDGQLRGNAKLRSPVVVLSFTTNRGRLLFPSDRYTDWLSNLSAIARTLENLRAIDRYGVQQGRQYDGYKQIAARSGATLTSEQAAKIIRLHARADSVRDEDLLRDRASARDFIRIAKKNTHPDAGGSADLFAAVGMAEQVLAAHHGGAL